MLNSNQSQQSIDEMGEKPLQEGSMEREKKDIKPPRTPPNQMIPEPVCPGAPQKPQLPDEREEASLRVREGIPMGPLLGGKEGKKLCEI